MSIVIKKDIIYKCSVDAILHPTPEEELKRLDKTNEVWTMFRTYEKRGSNYVPRICVGMAPPLSVGDNLTLCGDLVDTEKYGEQFQFSVIQKQTPTERNGIITFFVKNINGVGPSTAEKIVDSFGLDVIDKIRQDASILESISGISKIKATKISEQLGGLQSSIDELKFYARTNLGSARVLAIKTTYAKIGSEKGKTIDIIKLIKANPYKLVDDVKGIGFRVADSVAINIGFPKDSPLRIKAGIEFALKEEVEAKGNLWTDQDALIKLSAGKAYLNLSPILVSEVLEDMIVNKKLIKEENRVYLPYYYYLEFSVANKIKEMMDWPAPPIIGSLIDTDLSAIQSARGRTLDLDQQNAIKLCIENNVSIITGGPGVGKTTTLDTLLCLLETKYNTDITMAAPTGRAAKRMTEQTGRVASTIHSLSIRRTSKDFEIGTKRQALVIDESSMVDISVLKLIMDLCDKSTKLIFVGDVDQLPSIGPGQVLRDLIESKVIPTARLTKIHRQSEDSHIITNAHLCINGKHFEKERNKDFFIAERETQEECIASLKNYILSVYPKKIGILPKDIQILAPLKKGALGVLNLNNVMQEAINPKSKNKNEIELKQLDGSIIIREGDRVIQNKNDYNIQCSNGDNGVFNGEIGSISEIINDDGAITIVVSFSDRDAFYDIAAARNLSLAYAITIHKSQGSEFKAVILPLFSYGVPTIYNRNLLYTAVTRAKSYCCIIGKRDVTNKMIHNNKIAKRRTTLITRLIENKNPIAIL